MNALIKHEVITMTSLELVEFINSQRNEGEAVLAHSDFLKKVVQVLGAGVAGNFSANYTASNGKQNPCYELPKREACLMAMSYSYDLQAKVFDRMTELEEKMQTPRVMSPMEMVVMSAQAIMRLEQEQESQAKRLDNLEAKTTAVLGGYGFYTIVGYANLAGVKVDEALGSRLGKKAVAASKAAGVMTGKVGSTQWGGVNTYHETILAQVFHDHFGGTAK